MTVIRGEKRTRILKIAGILLLGMGLIILLGGMSLHFRSRGSASWPSTVGQVTVSETVTYSENSSQTEYGRPDSSGAGTGTTTATIHRPHIIYSYLIDGVRYENNQRTHFDGASEDPAYAEGILAQYPVGKQVTVYYDPDSPGNAVLEPGSDLVSLIPIVIGLLVCGIAAIPLYVVRAERRRAAVAA